MADQDSTPKPKWKKTTSLLLLLAGLAVVLIGVVIVGFQTHAESAKKVENDEILITNSGSTNTPGSTLTINPDGSGSIHYKKGRWPFGLYKDKTFAAHTFDSNQFNAILTEIKDVHSIPNHGCPKSVSFGSVITITYDGKTSGDISCLSMQDGKVLYGLRTLVQNTYALITHPQKILNIES